MEQSTLAEILGVEKDIRAQLDAAHEQASRWLEIQRREIEHEHEARLARLKSEAEQRRDAALHAARDAASAAVRRAESAAARQARLGDDELRTLLRRALGALLPGATR